MIHRSMACFVFWCTASLGQSGEMPEDIRILINEHYIGDWDFTMKSADGTIEGEFSATWAAGEHCILLGRTADGPTGRMDVIGVLAWRPDMKAIVHHGFSSNGDYFRIIYDSLDGNKWSGKFMGLVNGKRPVDSDAVSLWETDRITYKDAIYELKAKRKSEPVRFIDKNTRHRYGRRRFRVPVKLREKNDAEHMDWYAK